MTGALDASNGNGNGWGSPALVTDAHHDNNENNDVQEEGNCGGDGSGNDGGKNVVDMMMTTAAATAVLSQSLIDLRAVMSLALPARRCYQSSRD